MISQNVINGATDCANIAIDQGDGLHSYKTDRSKANDGNKLSWEGQSLAIQSLETIRELLTRSGTGLIMQQQVRTNSTSSWQDVGQPASFVGLP